MGVKLRLDGEIPETDHKASRLGRRSGFARPGLVQSGSKGSGDSLDGGSMVRGSERPHRIAAFVD
jgi:hypothetical protein